MILKKLNVMSKVWRKCPLQSANHQYLSTSTILTKKCKKQICNSKGHQKRQPLWECRSCTIHDVIPIIQNLNGSSPGTPFKLIFERILRQPPHPHLVPYSAPAQNIDCQPTASSTEKPPTLICTSKFQQSLMWLGSPSQWRYPNKEILAHLAILFYFVSF